MAVGGCQQRRPLVGYRSEVDAGVPPTRPGLITLLLKLGRDGIGRADAPFAAGSGSRACLLKAADVTHVASIHAISRRQASVLLTTCRRPAYGEWEGHSHRYGLVLLW